MTPDLSDIVPDARLELFQRRRSVGEVRLNGDWQTVKAVVHKHWKILAAVIVGAIVRVVNRRFRQSRGRLSFKILRKINQCSEEFIRKRGRNDPRVVGSGAMYVNSIDHSATRGIH